MRVHEGHRGRLKKRFLKSGLIDFEEHNVLELMLFYAIPRADTNELAHRLIKEFGSLARALDAPYEMLLQVEGVGENVATFLKLLPELCRRYLENKGEDVENFFLLDTKQKILNHLMPKFIGQRNEILVLICFDNKRKVVFSDVILEGSVNVTGVSVRKIVEQVVRHNAVAVLIAHNHPSGLAVPSGDDLAFTSKLYGILMSMDVELVDHYIIADNDAVSLKESALL